MANLFESPEVVIHGGCQIAPADAKALIGKTVTGLIAAVDRLEIIFGDGSTLTVWSPSGGFGPLSIDFEPWVK